MILKIKVDGFKTLSNFEMTLNPGLNVLVGPNGSGKTNIVSFFEFLTHLIEADPAEATSHLGGVGAIFRRVKDSYQPTISATVVGCFPFYQENRPIHFISEENKNKFGLYQYDFSMFFSNELESVILSSQAFKFKKTKAFITAESLEQECKNWELDIESSIDTQMETKIKLKSSLEIVKQYLPFFPDDASFGAQQAEELLRRLTSTSALPSIIIRFNPNFLPLSADITGGQTYNIIPSRIKLPEDSAKPPGISSDGSGLSATLYWLKRRSTASQAGLWRTFRPTRQNALKTPTLEMLIGYFQLANKSIENVDVTHDSFNNQVRVTFKIQNGEYLADVPLSLMSDGTLKWITLLTATLTASSVFSIEEPENYLHPKMQGQCVDVMRKILFSENKNTCSLMTTHSQTLLDHCKPSELIIVTLQGGKTIAYRCKNETDISDEIEKTGFGLGYYYINNAFQYE